MLGTTQGTPDGKAERPEKAPRWLFEACIPVPETLYLTSMLVIIMVIANT